MIPIAALDTTITMETITITNNTRKNVETARIGVIAYNDPIKPIVSITP